MIKFSKRLITRFLIVFFSGLAVFLVIFFVFSNTVNAHLERKKTSLESFFSGIIKQEIKIQSVRYIFPGTLVLNNILIGNINYLDNNVPFQAERAKLNINLYKLIFKKKFIFSDLVITRPQFVLSDNIFLLMKLFENSNKKDDSRKSYSKFSIFIDKGLLISITEDNRRVYRTIDASIEINTDGTLTYEGKLFYDRFIKDESNFLKCSLIIQFKNMGFSIRKFELDMRDSYLKLWGRFISNNLILNGYMLSKDSLRETKLEKITLKDNLNSLLTGRIKPRIRSVTSIHSGMNITDIDCKVDFGNNELNIKRLYFDLNKVPFLVTGKISFSKQPLFNIKLSSLPNIPENKRYNDQRAIDLEIKGQIKKDGFYGNILFTFARKTRHVLLKESLKGTFEKLNVEHTAVNLVKVSFLNSDVSYKTQTNTYDLTLSDFDCNLDSNNIFVKNIEFNSRIFDGFLKGVGNIDTRRVPYKINLNIDVRDISCEIIHSLSRYFCRVFGKLEGSLQYKGVNDSQLTGTLLIKDGYLDNLSFFVWLADSFDIPSVKQQRFDQLSTNLIIDDDGCNLKDINLEHDELSLKGFFKLHGEDMVTSKLSLFLGEDLVKASRKFRSLRGVLGEDLSRINFDFQLSGLFERMNFMWLESDFKTAVEKRIPNFIERAIEVRIERALESMKDKPQKED